MALFFFVLISTTITIMDGLVGQFFTKWVPRPDVMTRRKTDEAISTSLRRMKTDRIDLLQFHW